MASSRRNHEQRHRTLRRIEGGAPGGLQKPAHAATITVTNNSDSGPGSLREAIDTANATLGPDTIDFAIPGAGPHTITLLTDLPFLFGPTTIDGYTQPGATPATATTPATIKNRIDGSGPSNFALAFVAGGLLRGLSVTNFDGGVLLDGPSPTTVAGNFIGWAADGTTPAPNQIGIGTNSPGHLIGGASPAARNVIASSYTGVYLRSAGNRVEGNWIGTNATATSPGSSGDGDVYIGGSDNVIVDNLVAGGAANGVYAESVTNTTITGNRIGTNAAGAPLSSVAM